MAANRKREPNDYYKLIVAWLKGHDKTRSFSAKQIADDLVLEYNLVTVFLCRKTKKGYLRKSGFGQFVVVDPNIPLQISKGELADQVFGLLKELNLKHPEAYVRELFLKQRIDDAKVTLNSIHSIMQRWHEQGFVKHNLGGRGFRLKDEYLLSDSRPLVSSKKK